MIRTAYLYLASLVGLMLIVVGCVSLVNLSLKTFVFKQADQVIVYPLPTQPLELAETETEAGLTEQEQISYQAYREQERTAQRQRSAANALAMIIVGLPLYLYHWRTIGQDKD